MYLWSFNMAKQTAQLVYIHYICHQILMMEHSKMISGKTVVSRHSDSNQDCQIKPPLTIGCGNENYIRRKEKDYDA